MLERASTYPRFERCSSDVRFAASSSAVISNASASASSSESRQLDGRLAHGAGEEREPLLVDLDQQVAGRIVLGRGVRGDGTEEAPAREHAALGVDAATRRRSPTAARDRAAPRAPAR